MWSGTPRNSLPSCSATLAFVMAECTADEDVIFAKNNVNIVIKGIPPDKSVKVDGYLTIKRKTFRAAGGRPATPWPSLIAHWIPNEQLASSVDGGGGYTFTVDLKHMRSVRVFCCDSDKTRGQLVITTRENHFKVLHFPNGGLNHLVAVLEDWPLCSEQQLKPAKERDHDGKVRSFVIHQAALRDEQYHPEEGMFAYLSIDSWQAFQDDQGVILNSQLIRRIVFFGGVESAARPLVWPFLLGFYSFDSTREERLALYQRKLDEYGELDRKRSSFLSECKDPGFQQILRKMECDVLRTDRSSPFYAGEGNPNVDLLREVLLNYCVYDQEMTYTQGMSDLLSPILSVLQDRVISFWCFTHLMKKSQFLATPVQAIHSHLAILQELTKLLLPEFYHHFAANSESMEMIFCHRWFLLFFKREFSESDILSLWECLWSEQLTEYFHLFIALAIIAVYGNDVLEKKLSADDTLMHFTQQAKVMSSNLVLTHARGFLSQLGQYQLLPCSMELLVEHSNMWKDSQPPQLVCSQQCDHNKTTVDV